jgi:hypothetical protein
MFWYYTISGPLLLLLLLLLLLPVSFFLFFSLFLVWYELYYSLTIFSLAVPLPRWPSFFLSLSLSLSLSHSFFFLGGGGGGAFDSSGVGSKQTEI